MGNRTAQALVGICGRLYWLSWRWVQNIANASKGVKQTGTDLGSDIADVYGQEIAIWIVLDSPGLRKELGSAEDPTGAVCQYQE